MVPVEPLCPKVRGDECFPMPRANIQPIPHGVFSPRFWSVVMAARSPG